MEKNREVPIILEKPFLATGPALIDVANGDLTMRVFDKEVPLTFRVIKYPNIDDFLRLMFCNNVLTRSSSLTTLTILLRHFSCMKPWETMIKEREREEVEEKEVGEEKKMAR